ncbi:MAG TPA: ABC transporter ATP-binding protein [Rhodocyclaceae bacterium]|nr:ABC transporter ATP-binding protein [Rhodocyclaceae bacterium]
MSPAVRLSGVRKSFGAVQALAGISLDIAAGEFFGLLGPNGAGKTTLIGALAGLVVPDSGSLEVMGFDVQQQYREARLRLGVVPQELVFDPFFTVRETLRLQSGYFGIARNDDWIDELLHHLDLTTKADVNMRRLSGGMKRRVLVAQALVHRPPVIVLDEPTAGVDVELRQGLWAFIERLNKQGHTILLTTHYLEEAEQLCNRIAMLKAGRIIALDDKDALLRRFSTHSMRLRLADGGVLPEFLQAGAQALADGAWRLPLPNFGGLEARLAALREAGLAIAELSLEEPDLEEVFVQLMRGDSAAPLAEAA